jgi:hypothetical protein
LAADAPGAAASTANGTAIAIAAGVRSSFNSIGFLQ